MKRSIIKNVLAISLVLSIAAGSFQISYAAAEQHSSLSEMQETLDNYKTVTSYHNLMLTAPAFEAISREYIIEADSYVNAEGMEPQIFENYAGAFGNSVLTGERGMIEWSIDIEQDGFYNINVDYFPIEGRSADIQRAVFIDGELPFAEASVIEFSRVWVNEGNIHAQDTQGNDLKPKQIESPVWCSADIEDHENYYSEPFLFYLTKGTHMVSFVSSREPMLIRRIKLYQAYKPVTYEEKLAEYEKSGYKPSSGQLEIIQAEEATSKSSPMLYPLNDHSSPAITPYDAKLILNNSIGGNNWAQSGQWIEWKVNAEESGLYQIALNIKQNFVRGTKVYRKLYIDGYMPFAEAGEIGFAFEKDWRVETLGDDNGAYLFYLEKGEHTIRLEVVLGELRDYVRRIEEKVLELNEMYRQIVMIMSSEPDVYRDYRLEMKMPGLAEGLAWHRDDLNQMYDDLVIIAGGKGQRDAILQTMAQQLDYLSKDVEKFTTRLGLFKTNIGALGTWLLQAKEQKIQLDSLTVYSPNQKPEKLKNSFVSKIVHEFLSMIYSFIIDYNAIGKVDSIKESKTITVWNGQGRDQANVLKSLIDESFTNETGIGVNLMLVNMDTLLKATMSGQGPDVAMQVPGDWPMNYGMRGAVYDLSNFSDLLDITKRFTSAIMTPFDFDGKVFALPETMYYNMMFYRKDILDELNIKVPETWEELSEAISMLAINNMAFGMLPTPETTYGMLLFQNGGKFYSDDYKSTDIDSDIGINSFKQMTKLYTDYGLELQFDFANRFRTGEMPLGIADYTTYNTFQVFAPEIKGLWGFSLVPGTKKDDDTVDHSVVIGSNAIIIMNSSGDKESSWEYLKWWTSSEIQTKYGREMEALMGSAARYPTANLDALQNLPWPVEDFDAISEQLAYAKGYPQIPGGYFTGRYINNSFYKVVVSKKIGAREALMDNVRYINEEIAYKRAEFGLDN